MGGLFSTVFSNPTMTPRLVPPPWRGWQSVGGARHVSAGLVGWGQRALRRRGCRRSPRGMIQRLLQQHLQPPASRLAAPVCRRLRGGCWRHHGRPGRLRGGRGGARRQPGAGNPLWEPFPRPRRWPPPRNSRISSRISSGSGGRPAPWSEEGGGRLRHRGGIAPDDVQAGAVAGAPFCPPSLAHTSPSTALEHGL